MNKLYDMKPSTTRTDKTFCHMHKCGKLPTDDTGTKFYCPYCNPRT